MNLKNAFGQIKAYGGNLHGGWLLCSGCLTANPLWHSEAGSGSHPHHLLWAFPAATREEPGPTPPEARMHPRPRCGRGNSIGRFSHPTISWGGGVGKREQGSATTSLSRRNPSPLSGAANDSGVAELLGPGSSP